MNKRAVLYARVSGDDRGRDGRNLEGQLEMGREYAKRHGLIVVEELAEDDRGASGASFELPQLNRVYEMARDRELDVLVVREIDRLSRKLAKQLIVEEELKRHGVQIEYVLGEYPDTPEGNLMKNVRATIAEYEREKINERMVRGRQQKVKAGNVMMHGHAPYGYREVEVGGKRVLVIDEEEAQVVRMIFAWYCEGKSSYSITLRLSEMGVPSYTDKRKDWHVKKRPAGSWSHVTVQEMLRNETYAGVWRYGETKLPVPVPPIVDSDSWAAAKTRMRENKENSRRGMRYQYLMRRRMTCGTCGVKMVAQSKSYNGKLYQYYRCPANARGIFAHDCDLPSFRADKVDPAIWEWIKSRLTDLGALQEGLEIEQASRERENAPLQGRLEVVNDLLADNKAQLARLLDLYLAGSLPMDMLLERKKRLEETIRALETEQTGLTTHLERAALTPKQMRTIVEFAAEVAEGLDAAEDDFDAQVQVIETLDARASLAIEDGKQVIFVRCILGDSALSLMPASSGFGTLSSRRRR